MVNRLVLNLKRYSNHESGATTSHSSPLSQLKFHYSKTLGNIGAPLDFEQGIEPSVEIEVITSEIDGSHQSTAGASLFS